VNGNLINARQPAQPAALPTVFENLYLTTNIVAACNTTNNKMISAYGNDLTFTTLQTRSFLISWSVRGPSY